MSEHAPQRERVSKRRRVLKRRQRWWENPRVLIAMLVLCGIFMAAAITELAEWWVALPPPPEVMDPDAPPAQ